MKLSIIVCTRNRAHNIIPCLDSIVASLAHAAPIEAEVVVVDNASEDNTSAIIKEWATSCPFPVRLQYELQKGAAWALNCGLRTAQGDLFIITDDDCRLDENHISAALRHDAADTELVLRGGRIELGDPTDLPITIKTELAPKRWSRAMNSARHEHLSGCISGCNMALRRAVVERVGLFNERFGPGTTLPGADDTDYIFRAYLAGIPVEYVPDMVVFHHHGRKTNSAGKKLMQNYMISEGGLFAKYIFRHFNFCRSAYWNSRLAVKEIISGKNLFMPEVGFSYKGVIACHALGALRYFVSSLKSARRAA